MKAVLMSIQPKWCELIASGKKTVEVRKTKPKLEVPFKVYIYETKDKRFENIGCYWGKGKFFEHATGKILGEFVCDQIDEIGYSPEMHGKYISDIDDIHYVSCLNFEQMFDYLADGYGYAWHISDILIYDKPKELSQVLYRKQAEKCVGDCEHNGMCQYCKDIRPPQSWCYVEEVEQCRMS